jgi:hypothetical protein
VGARAEQVLGRPLRSNYLRAGPVPHRGVKYDKQRGLAGAQAKAVAPPAAPVEEPTAAPTQGPAARA